MLQARAVAKSYGRVRALDGVSFELAPGRVLAVVGANGAGKSTLIKSVVALIRFEGQILVDGIDVARNPKEARRRIGYLSQEAALHPDLTVAETAAFYAALRGLSPERARECVELVGLGSVPERRVAALSGGMRRRLALAVALLADPPLLVLDEPASGLDVAARVELRRLIADQRAAGKSVLLSTHWLEDVPHIADDVLVLDRGRAVFLGPAREFLEAPAVESRLYLRINGRSQEALELLRRTMPQRSVQRLGDWVVVPVRAPEKAAILHSLVDEGIPVSDVRVEEAPADDALRRLTEVDP
ncbi:ABC transporter ATP-binding protein NatA [bacterium HR29]|nr:ABC transporter ATP-binding protein NatA [bacterium HR29]